MYNHICCIFVVALKNEMLPLHSFKQLLPGHIQLSKSFIELCVLTSDNRHVLILLVLSVLQFYRIMANLVSQHANFVIVLLGNLLLPAAVLSHALP